MHPSRRTAEHPDPEPGARSEGRPLSRRAPALGALLLAAWALSGRPARADEAPPPSAPPDLVKQANAPLSGVMQLRFQNTYIPEFHDVDGDSNTLTLAITMPLPKYRLIPFPQLSLLTIPSAVTLPDGHTGFGDVRFVDVAVLNPGRRILLGIGPTFVFPTATERTTGQAKWQAGPALAVAFTPDRWLVGMLAQNPISFAGDRHRADTNALFLQPFVTYQLGQGWFLRSQPQMFFDWKNHGHAVPLDLGAGRTFQIGGQNVSVFVEPFWTALREGPAPVWGVTVGGAFLYPDVWRAD